jgi:flagellar basal body rod protein FlgC
MNAAPARDRLPAVGVLLIGLVGLAGCEQGNWPSWRPDAWWPSAAEPARPAVSDDVRRYVCRRAGGCPPGADWPAEGDPELRGALVDALDLLAVRIGYAEENLAHVGATRDERTGRPYRPKRIRILASGEPEVVEQAGALMAVHRPSDPDADASGYVYCPNISVPAERAERSRAIRDYNALLARLKELDPTVRDAPWPEE